ncbi:MAG: hypothetical protein Ct9H300mP29_5340 [Candidatus Neomarinimicrobiota bacterium]|nr:MAG: hypothetical protein Ct9H300mP29_5340 [Candidatus Neomarinimicrobiota bacterium]
MPDSKESLPNRSFYYFQKFLAKSGPARLHPMHLLGILLFSLAGYLLIILPVIALVYPCGTFLGILVGFYELVKVIWSK